MKASTSNYLQRATTRASISEERSKMLTIEVLNLTLERDALKAKIRELEMALDVANKLIVVLTPAKRKVKAVAA